MKNPMFILIFQLVLSGIYEPCFAQSKGVALQQIMDKYTQMGLPGVSMAIYSEDGPWAGASGYAKIETRTPMQPGHLQYSQSVSKTYMAVAILKLYEQGKINLDEKITAYLPESITAKVTGADQMTVRMLLNHTSGAAEYNMAPAYVSYLLQHPLHPFTPMDYLDFVAGQPLQFTPGSKYRYTNTNYELLAMIGDGITGDHTQFIRDEIFKPLGLVNSFYHENTHYLDRPELVDSYWDRYSNGVLENCTQMHRVNVASMIGDDGMVATSMDYVLFLKGLFEGKLLSKPTLEQMMDFVLRDPANEKSYGYGLGIHRDYQQGLVEYGHTGGGIGAGCYLGYFPDRNLYFFLGINLGTSVNSPILERVAGMLEEVLIVLVE